MAQTPTPQEKEHNFHLQAMLLAEVIKRILQKKGQINITEKPTLVLKPISEFMRRMRVSSFEKFDHSTFIATVNFYLNQDDFDHNRALGAIVLYVGEQYIVRLLNRLGYPDINEDDPLTLEDACGTFCNLIAGNFNAGLTQLGFNELIMSHFSTYQNEIINGVDFCSGEKFKYELTFEIDDIPQIIVEYTMGYLPKIGELTEPFYF